MILTDTLTNINIMDFYYVIATLIIASLGYFIKDLHKLIKSLNVTVIELNTTVEVIRKSHEKEIELINNMIKDRTIRIHKIEMKLDKYDTDITDFFKSFDDKIDNKIDRAIKNSK